MTFVDTGGWVVLFVPADTRHVEAKEWISANSDRLVTSDYIVDEVLTLINIRFRRQTAMEVGQALFDELLCQLIYLTNDDSDKHGAYFDLTATKDGASLIARV